MNGEPAVSNKRFVIWSVVLSVLLAAALVAGAWQYSIIRPELTVRSVQDTAREGDYSLMQEQLKTLSQMEDDAFYYDSVLACAGIAYTAGEVDLALELLESAQEKEGEAYASFRQRAQSQSAVYTYRKAELLYEKGDYARAAHTASQVRWYAPAMELYEKAQAAYEEFLAAQATPVPTATPVPVPEKAALWPEGRLAAGFEHTVVLLDDGTVRAFGGNTYGQLNVEEWKDVVYVAAGAYHTLGLTADGRVLACGDNTHHQTETDMLTGVRAIAAGDYASFALLENGQVMDMGYLEHAFLEEVFGAQAIWAGSYGLLVKTPAGVLASHPSISLQGEWTQAAVSRGYAVAVDAEGSTLSSTELVPQWSGVQRLAAGENAVIALNADGEVLSHVFGHGTLDLTFDQPVLAVAAGPAHYAFLLEDGTLEIRFAGGEAQKHQLN